MQRKIHKYSLVPSLFTHDKKRISCVCHPVLSPLIHYSWALIAQSLLSKMLVNWNCDKIREGVACTTLAVQMVPGH